MTIRGFLSAVAVSAALLGSAAGCGVKTGDEVAADQGTAPTTASTTTTGKGSDGPRTTEATTDEETTTTADGSDSDTSLTVPGGDFDVRGAMIDGFTSAGFTREQAECLADEFEKMGLTTGSSTPDMDATDMLAVFDRCHISLEDLGKLGGAGG